MPPAYLVPIRQVGVRTLSMRWTLSMCCCTVAPVYNDDNDIGDIAHIFSPNVRAHNLLALVLPFSSSTLTTLLPAAVCHPARGQERAAPHTTQFSVQCRAFNVSAQYSRFHLFRIVILASKFCVYSAHRWAIVVSFIWHQYLSSLQIAFTQWQHSTEMENGWQTLKRHQPGPGRDGVAGVGCAAYRAKKIVAHVLDNKVPSERGARQRETWTAYNDIRTMLSKRTAHKDASGGRECKKAHIRWKLLQKWKPIGISMNEPTINVHQMT